jgi:hypothetical protein
MYLLRSNVFCAKGLSERLGQTAVRKKMNLSKRLSTNYQEDELEWLLLRWSPSYECRRECRVSIDDLSRVGILISYPAKLGERTSELFHAARLGSAGNPPARLRCLSARREQ